MIDRAASSDAAVRELLTRHPDVARVEAGDRALEFEQRGRLRSIQVDAETGLSGLVELIDNNPLVCADTFSVLSAGGVLASIALGPLVLAGLLLEEPTMIVSEQVSEESIRLAMRHLGADVEVVLHVEPRALGSVVAATAIAAIPTPTDWTEIGDLYDERFGRSFFVVHDETSEWATSLADGGQEAFFRLRPSPGDDTSLLTVAVLADRHGKLGAGQIVHAMNVMAGFEESLGIA